MRCRSYVQRPFGSALLAALLVACTMTGPQQLPAPTRVDTPRAAAPTEAPAVADLPAPPMLARGLHEREIGAYDEAANDFYALVNSYPQASEARPARYYLAESFALRGRWASAADALRAFLAENTQDDYTTRALFWLARSHEEAGNWDEAAHVYAQYRALHTPLELYATLREAAQQQANGQSADAAANYELVARSDLARGERAGAHEKAIALERQLGRNDKALELYTHLLGSVEQSSYRARILDEAATLARAQHAQAQAHTWDSELITHYPESSAALAAVTRIQADQPGLPAGTLAHVYEAHEQFETALPLLDVAIAAASNGDARELQRRRALALRAGGDLDATLAALAAISAADPNDDTGRQAQLDWAQTRGQQGETQAAIDAYRAFGQTYPDDKRAPEALGRAATLLERQGDQEGAIAERLALGTRYPSNEQAQDALDLAAWHFFRTNRPAAAQSAWDLLSTSTTGAVSARAAFWAARAADAAGANAAAPTLIARARQQAPNSYYGLRAAELQNTTITASAPLTATTTVAQWNAAENWIAAWDKSPASPQRSSAAIRDNTAVARALALADVGLFDDAVAEWNEARAQWKTDPFKLYAVARLASENGMPYIGLKAAEDLVALAPNNAPPQPVAIQRLRYPTPYPDLIMAQARAFGLDPRALYAMLRQESLFDPHAASGAGARGLAQIMPTTAQGIAADLQVEFSENDLERPLISVRFGAFYLSRQLKLMSGNLPGALAAYNGGYGNATRWANGNLVADQDMFVETIDFPETAGYVKLVYSYYGAYRSLYTDAQG